MDVTFHFRRDDDEPKLPERNREVLHLDAIPANNPAARLQLIVEAIPLVHYGYWDLLGNSTTERLSQLGLIRLVPGRENFDTTPAFDRLKQVIDALPSDAKSYAIRAVELGVERGNLGTSLTVCQHMLDTLSVVRGSRSERREELAMVIRKLVLAFVEDATLHVGTFDGSIEKVLGKRYDRWLLSRSLMDYLTTTEYYQQKEALGYLFEVGRHNSPPFLMGRRFKKDVEEVRHRAETIVARSYKFTMNFDRLLCEARRTRPDQPSLLARFGEQCFEESWRVKALDKNRPPGPGFLLRMPSVDKLFFGGRQAAEWYKEAYKSYGQAFTQLASTSYLIMRSGYFVFNTDPIFSLPVDHVATGLREPYCGVFLNNHLSPSFDLAGMLPVRIVRRHIKWSLEGLRSTEDDPEIKDVTSPGFTFESLARESEAEGLPALRLANISVAFGGAVAAYPKSSKPFYDWEPRSETGLSLWQDGLGRVHHAWRARDYDGYAEKLSRRELGKKRIEILAPLGEGCRLVATAAEGFLNLMDMFMWRYDAWKCGVVPGQVDPAFMLREALADHRALRERNAPESDYPVLCLVDKYDWSAKPEAVLDVYNLNLFLKDGGMKQLSASPSALERAESLWEVHAMPRAIAFVDGMRQETEKSFAFLPRSHVLGQTNQGRE